MSTHRSRGGFFYGFKICVCKKGTGPKAQGQAIWLSSGNPSCESYATVPVPTHLQASAMQPRYKPAPKVPRHQTYSPSDRQPKWLPSSAAVPQRLPSLHISITCFYHIPWFASSLLFLNSAFRISCYFTTGSCIQKSLKTYTKRKS